MTGTAMPELFLEAGVRRSANEPLRIVLHVGAFKTGTSYLQNAFWAGREQLAAAGVLFPGKHVWGDQVLAVRDVLEMNVNNKRQPGMWGQLVEMTADWPGTHALISMEFLSLASAARAEQIAQSFAPAQVEVVLGVRDLVRVIPASYQERIKNGLHFTWSEFVDGIRHHPRRPPGKAFWVQQDLPSIARRWTEALGRDRVTLVTVPGSGADQATLLLRFGQAMGVDLSGVDSRPEWANRSLGAGETEALRRLNAAVGNDATNNDWVLGVKRVLARESVGQRSRPLLLTADDLVWVAPMQRRIIDELRAGEWPVVGGLAELDNTEPRLGTRAVDDVDEADVSAALLEVAVSFTRNLVKVDQTY